MTCSTPGHTASRSSSRPGWRSLRSTTTSDRLDAVLDEVAAGGLGCALPVCAVMARNQARCWWRAHGLDIARTILEATILTRTGPAMTEPQRRASARPADRRLRGDRAGPIADTITRQNADELW